MNLLEDFQGVVEASKRPLAAFALAVSTLPLTGCLATGHPNTGNIFTDAAVKSVQQDFLGVRRDARQGIRGIVNPTVCAGGGVAVTAAQCPDQLNRGGAVQPRSPF